MRCRQKERGHKRNQHQSIERCVHASCWLLAYHCEKPGQFIFTVTGGLEKKLTKAIDQTEADYKKCLGFNISKTS